MHHPTVETELAANAQALRRLARDLVGRNDADDLVQETALRALGHPPARPGNLGAWLGTILRRLAGNHRRAQRRRGAREAAIPAAELQAPADATASHRESLQAVTQSLLALAEPYGTTLFQRYFEGLSPTAIAGRAGVPLATVKSRLQRGILMLRERLDAGRQRDRWRTALLPAVGLAPFSLPLISLPLTLLMSKTGKLLATAFAIVALFASAVVLWPSEAAPVTVADVHVPEAASAAASPISDSAPLPPRTAERLPAAATVSDAPKLDLAHPYAYTLNCRVIDRDGLPVEGASLLLAPRGTALNTWPTATGASGCVDITWRARTPAMTLAIGVANALMTPSIQEVDLHEGRSQLVLLGEAKAAVVRVRSFATQLFVQKKENPPEPTCTQPGTATQECTTCHHTAGFRGLAVGNLQARPGLHPEARFGDLLLPAPPAGAPPKSPASEQLAVAKMRAAERNAQAEALTRKTTRDRTPSNSMGVLTGTVYGEDGKPVADATVVWGPAEDRPSDRVRSGKDGTFRFEGLGVSKIIVRAGGAESGIGTAYTITAPGAEVRCDVSLRTGASLRGKALGRNGALKGWRVEYLAANGAWIDSATVRTDGTFRFCNLPGPGRLLLFAADVGLPVAIEPLANPDISEVVFDLRVRGEPLGGLRLRPTLPKDLQASAEVRVWQVDSRCGTGMVRSKSGAFTIDGLAAGFYRVEIGAEATGWLELPPIWVDGGGVIDLGTVALPTPGELLLPNQPALDGIELYHRRLEGDVRAERGLGGRDGVTLPTGEWLVFWKVGERIDSRAFTIRPGIATKIQLGGR